MQPTVREIYALCAALCEHAGEEFPETREDASELIERVREEIGHPRPRLEDTPRRWRRRRRHASDDQLAREVSRELARALR